MSQSGTSLYGLVWFTTTSNDESKTAFRFIRFSAFKGLIVPLNPNQPSLIWQFMTITPGRVCSIKQFPPQRRHNETTCDNYICLHYKIYSAAEIQILLILTFVCLRSTVRLACHPIIQYSVHFTGKKGLNCSKFIMLLSF